MAPANYNNVPCLTVEKVIKVIFSCAHHSSNARTCTALYAVVTSDWGRWSIWSYTL